jgi:hypothetical protein
MNDPGLIALLDLGGEVFGVMYNVLLEMFRGKCHGC